MIAKSRSVCLVLLIIASFIVGCGRQSIEDFQEEGRAITRTLIKKFAAVSSKHQLQEASTQLERLFDHLVDILIQAKTFQENHPETIVVLTNEDLELNEQLISELNRIYAMEGGKKLLEKCQEHALRTLDAFDKKLKKKRTHSGQ